MRSILSFLVVSLFVVVNGRFGPSATVQLIAAPDTGKDPVTGSLYLTQTPGGVMINGIIFGLEPGKHGFHVHAVGDLGNKCKNAGGHFNPLKKQHGKPTNADNRHAGDLGNIVTPPSRVTFVTKFDRLISLDAEAENGITGRAFVLHAGEDDLGMGGDDESLKTGNAGARLACGIVEPLNY